VPEESTRAPLYARGAPIEEEPPLDFTHIPQDYGLNGGGLHDVVPSERKKSNGKHKKKKDRQGGRGVHAANGFSAQSSGYQNFLDDDTDDYGGYSSNAFGATAAMLGGSSAASMLGQSVQAAQQTAPNPYAPAFEPNAGAPAFVPLSFPPASSAAASATPSLFADETTLGRTNPQPQLAESTGAPVALSGQPVYVRTATAKDIEACASFMYKAFRQAADRANAYSDTARTPERTAQIIQDAVESDGVHAVVAVAPHAGSGGGGELCLGFNCLHEANAPLFGVGPLGVNPDYQSQSIGRQLVAAALQRAATVMQGLHGTTTTIGDGDDGGGGGNSSPRQDQAAAAGVATDASAGAAVDGLPAAVEPSAEQAPQQAGDGTDGSHGGPTMAGQPPLHSEAPSADDSKAAKPAATVRLTVDAYNSVAMALYVKSGFVVSETLTVLHSPPLDLSKAAAALGPLDDGWVFDEMEDSDLDACDVLSTRYAGCSRAGEIFAALQRPREQGGVYVVRGADGNIEGYTTGLNFWGHTVASSTEAAVALFKGVRQQDATADLRVIMPYRTQPRLGSWCLDHGVPSVAVGCACCLPVSLLVSVRSVDTY
jgi:GNAT superfamily N-acetyltransferase